MSFHLLSFITKTESCLSSNLGVEGLVDGVLRLGLHLSPSLAVDVVRVELGYIGRQVAPVKCG